MNNWTQKSVELANQRNYLDQLYRVYPLTQNLRRELTKDQIKSISEAFNRRDNKALISRLLTLELFPIKDSYVAYLKRDKTSIDRNPNTVDRIAGLLHEIGLDEVIENCSQPKETNRQIGPLFKQWIDRGTLGVQVYSSPKEFLRSTSNAILNASDAEMMKFANEYLGYQREKGLDFIARFNNKYIVAEAKFLTDFGGHQNAQFADAISTLVSPFVSQKLKCSVIPIAIMDGVLFIKSNNKLYSYLEDHPDQVILSALFLREFLYSL